MIYTIFHIGALGNYFLVKSKSQEKNIERCCKKRYIKLIYKYVSSESV
jgi:hypothetical protein